MDITKLLKKMKKKDLLTAYALKENKRLEEEYKKPDKVGLTNKQKYIRRLKNGRN